MLGFLGGGFDSCQGDALAYQNIITGLGVCQQVERDIFQRAADELRVRTEDIDDFSAEQIHATASG
jgi:hypothetical protein